MRRFALLLLFCGLLLAASARSGTRASQDAVPPGCPPQGDATKPKVQGLNEKKARVDAPSDDDVDDTADVNALIAPGDDELRWQDTTAVEINAFVLDVQDGGPASSNCHASSSADQDTVLFLSPGGSVSDNAHRMIAVITPQWRRLMARNGADWSTGGIRAKYLQHYATIQGWLLFDFEAAARALNTAPLSGANITRATAWEIHPVTSIAPSGGSLEQQTRLEPHREESSKRIWRSARSVPVDRTSSVSAFRYSVRADVSATRAAVRSFCRVSTRKLVDRPTAKRSRSA